MALFTCCHHPRYQKLLFLMHYKHVLYVLVLYRTYGTVRTAFPCEQDGGDSGYVVTRWIPPRGPPLYEYQNPRRESRPCRVWNRPGGSQNVQVEYQRNQISCTTISSYSTRCQESPRKRPLDRNCNDETKVLFPSLLNMWFGRWIDVTCKASGDTLEFSKFCVWFTIFYLKWIASFTNSQDSLFTSSSRALARNSII